jgi:hypothetical protein
MNQVNQSWPVRVKILFLSTPYTGFHVECGTLMDAG